MRGIELNSKYIALLLFFVAIAGYSLFQARFLILGPRVSIASPHDGALVTSSVVILEGVAKNVAWMSLNGKQIFTDENGKWSEKLLVSPGLSIMTVEARDRFGRSTEKKLRIVLN